MPFSESFVASVTCHAECTQIPNLKFRFTGKTLGVCGNVPDHSERFGNVLDRISVVLNSSERIETFEL